MKIAFTTLGCKLNYAETSTYERGFKEAGWDVVPWSQQADVYLINTCAVTETAEKKSRNLIRRAHKTAPDARIVVTGCYAQLRKEQLLTIDGVWKVYGAEEKKQILDLPMKAADQRSSERPAEAVSDEGGLIGREPQGDNRGAEPPSNVHGIYGGTVSKWEQKTTFGVPQERRRLRVPSPTSMAFLSGASRVWRSHSATFRSFPEVESNESRVWNRFQSMRFFATLRMTDSPFPGGPGQSGRRWWRRPCGGCRLRTRG